MRPARIHLLLVGLALVGVGSAGCGGSQSGAQTPRASVQAPAEAAASPAASQRKQTSGSHSKHEARKTHEPSRAVDREAARQQQLESVNSPKTLDTAAAPARSVCRLVSTSEATTILGKAVQTPIVAKQGPTCLYRTRDGALTTVSVQAAALRELTAHMRKQHDVAIGGRSGVCGTLGGPLLYLPVGTRKVLAVTGQCDVARQFAGRALPRIGR